MGLPSALRLTSWTWAGVLLVVGACGDAMQESDRPEAAGTFDGEGRGPPEAGRFGDLEEGLACASDDDCPGTARCVVIATGEFARGTCQPTPSDASILADGGSVGDANLADARDGARTDFDLVDGGGDARDGARTDFDLVDGGGDARDGAGTDFDLRDAGDGAADVDADASPACVVGTTERCYPGPPATEGVGPCHAGTRTCVRTSAGTAWGACSDAVVPAPDTTCDGIDQDCDGASADGADLPTFGTLCPKAGLPTCSAGVLRCAGASLACGDAICLHREICGDGFDNDCNGTADDGCPKPTVRVGCPDAPFATLAAAVAGRTESTRFEICGGTYAEVLAPPAVPMEFVAVPGTGRVILGGTTIQGDAVRLGSYRTLAYRFEGVDVEDGPERGIDGSCVDLTLDDANVRRNGGGGVSVRDSKLVVIDSRVESNRLLRSTDLTRVEGVGIRAARSTVILRRATLAANVGTQTAAFGTSIAGGGVYLDGSILTAEDSSISDNELDGNYSGANPQGAAIYGFLSRVDLTRVRVVGNTNRGISQTYGGGIAVDNLGASRPAVTPWVRLTDSTVTGNTIPRGLPVGGAVHVRTSGAPVTDVLVVTNTDFGSGPSANAPADVALSNPSPSVSRVVSGAGVSFACGSNGVCTP
ncbi:MAG: right-handed parallel beta-helix repeat-containing protein [Polyangiaceae bacterium]